MRRFFVSLLALLAFSLQLFAVKAYPYPVTVTQPDGSTITILIRGDENWSCKTTLSGRPVFQAADGFWRETDSVAAYPLLQKKLVPEGGSPRFLLATKASVNMKTLVIPVQFPDMKFTVPTPRNAIYNLFNQQYYAENGATGSVKDYFRDNMASFSNLVFDVCDVVTLPYGYAYYGENNSGMTDRNIKQMVVHACAAADDAGVDFSQYDFDGDGIVDNVFIIFAGHNEAEGGGDNTIWPQSWNVADQQLYCDGMKISNFSLYSEYAGSAGYRFAGIGTICHEYCHLFGLPDLYDVNDEKEGSCDALHKTLSIMDCGNYNNDGRTPPYLTIFERQIIGIASSKTVKQEMDLVIPPVYESDQAFVIPGNTVGENFWIEYHDGNKWDEFSGGIGLVVYHIDKSTSRAGSMTARMRWDNNAVNSCADHPCAIFISSSGSLAEDVSDAFFPGKRKVNAIHSEFSFPLVDWSGQGIGFGIVGFELGAGGMSCHVVVDDGWDLPQITGYSIIPDQTEAILEWGVDKPNESGRWVIEWGAKSSIDINRKELPYIYSSYTFTDLVPGTEYLCRMHFDRNGVRGKSYEMEFKAIDKFSDFPLIGGMDVEYKTGDKMRLFALNLPEENHRLFWSVNGKDVKDDVYIPGQPGSYRIECRILYEDLSEEILTKIITVE